MDVVGGAPATGTKGAPAADSTPPRPTPPPTGTGLALATRPTLALGGAEDGVWLGGPWALRGPTNREAPGEVEGPPTPPPLLPPWGGYECRSTDTSPAEVKWREEGTWTLEETECGGGGGGGTGPRVSDTLVGRGGLSSHHDVGRTTPPVVSGLHTTEGRVGVTAGEGTGCRSRRLDTLETGPSPIPSRGAEDGGLG